MTRGVIYEARRGKGIKGELLMLESIRKHYQIISALLIFGIMIISVLFGFKKHGFFIDEYYLYTFANGEQSGIAINVGEWNDTSDYIHLLVSEGDENFNFKPAFDFVKNGVHPFFYYMALHFVSSIFSGIFSKWIGISINIVLLVPILLLVRKTAWILSDRNEILTLLTLLLYGLSPATISMTVLVRMYLMLSLWTVWYAYLHVKDLERDKLSVARFLLPVFICGFCGFLTQYFFVVIMFFITFVYAFYLVFSCRRIKDAVIYGFTALASLISTYFVWPVSVYHIFKGYRGKGAFSQIKDLRSYWDRFWENIGYLNKMVFGGAIWVFIPLLIVGVILIVRRYLAMKKTSKTLKSFSVSTKGIILIGISSLLNFAVLSQISLSGGIVSCRQMYTAYALFLILLPVCIYKLLSCLKTKREWILLALPAAVVCLILILGHAQKNVIFLYENDKVATDYALEHPDAKVVMFQKDDGMYDSRIQELMLYPKVYYASVDDLNTAKDAVIADADELLVYMSSDTKKQEECFQSILQQNPKITIKDHLWDSDFFSVYLLH